jgi:hypothetical protein
VLIYRLYAGLMIAAMLAPVSVTRVTANQAKATQPNAEIQNSSFDPTLGVITFDLVNNASSALTAYTYEIRYTNSKGEQLVD